MDRLGISGQVRIAVVIVLVLVIVFGLAMFLVRPAFSEIKRIQSEIIKAQAEVVRLAEEIQNYKSTLAELDRVRNARPIFDSILPVREEMVNLVEGLELAVNRAGAGSSLVLVDSEIETKKSRPAANTEEAKPLIPGLRRLEEVDFTLTVQSDYRDLTDFFLFYENLPFISEVEHISLKADTLQNDALDELTNTGTATTEIDGVLFISEPL